MDKKYLFSIKTSPGNYKVLKEESADKEKVSVLFIKNRGKESIIYEIILDKKRDIVKIVYPFLGLRLFSSSANKSNCFIETPKQLTKFEKLNYPEYSQKYLTDSSSNITTAWLNLNGKRRNLGYLGSPGPGFVTYQVHKEYIRIISNELGLEVKEI